jgi:hypothetical protein
MRMRPGLTLAAALAAAGIAVATIKPAHAHSGWTYNPMTGTPLTFSDASQLPPDGRSKAAPFASYLYGSVIPAPRATATLAFAPLDGGTAHVAWCTARFRSYDPTTDTYRGFDGLRHRCESPY